ncbi:MAG: hypothetical protein AAF297_07155 [Planctomycetota bacterium]
MDSVIDQNTAQWIFYGAVTLAALFAGLHVVSSLVRNLTYVHDVQRSVAHLQNTYTRDLMRLRGLDVPEALDESDIVELDDEGNPVEVSPSGPETAAPTGPVADSIRPEVTTPDTSAHTPEPAAQAAAA